MNNIHKTFNLKQRNNTQKKSKTTQLNIDENLSMNGFQNKTKISSDISPINKQKSKKKPKTKEEKEKDYFISRIRQINENYKNLKNSKDLIIDTRRPPLNIINASKSPKFNFVDYRHKKYQTHIFPFKKVKLNDSYEKKNIINYNNNDNIIDDDNSSLEQKVKNMKYQLVNAPISGYIPNFALTYSRLPHRAVGNSLYTVLSMRKNQFIDIYDQSKEKEKTELPKLKQIQFLINNNSSSPMSNYFGKKNDYRKYVDLFEQPFSYISLLNDDFSMSEKMRFQKTMDKLNKVKKCIEENPDDEFEIAKEFILSIGLYDLSNLDIDKLNNFINFIKSDFMIDPSKNIKENVYNILNNNKINKPPISNALNCINEDYILNELEKRKNLIKHKKIGEYFNIMNDDIVQAELKNIKTRNKKDISISGGKIKNNTLNNFIDEQNKNLKINKKRKSQTISNGKYKQKPLEHKGLCVDLKRQQEINLYEKRKDLDLINSPKAVFDMIRKEINYKDKSASKTNYNWCRNVYKNQRLYRAKRQENAEYNEVKKKNMLTEYICLMKAKTNMKLSKLKETYKL